MNRPFKRTEQAANSLLDAQGFVCAVCGEPDGVGKVDSKRLALDHCHASGKLRGMLCYACNVGLGYFRDSPARLIAAARYLIDRGMPLLHQGQPVVPSKKERRRRLERQRRKDQAKLRACKR